MPGKILSRFLLPSFGRKFKKYSLSPPPLKGGERGRRGETKTKGIGDIFMFDLSTKFFQFVVAAQILKKNDGIIIINSETLKTIQEFDDILYNENRYIQFYRLINVLIDEDIYSPPDSGIIDDISFDEKQDKYENLSLNDLLESIKKFDQQLKIQSDMEWIDLKHQCKRYELERIEFNRALSKFKVESGSGGGMNMDLKPENSLKI